MPDAGGGVAGINANQNQNLNLNQKHNASEFLLSRNAEQINNAANNSGEKVPLDALMLAIMTERAELLESQLREQVNDIRGKNAQLKEANNVMAKARNGKKDSTDTKKTVMDADIKNFFKENDIPWGDKNSGELPDKLNGTQWDLAIENLKGWSESLTSTSQLAMTKLQSTSGKFNQTFEMLSQFISKYYRGGDSIIKNI